MGGLVGVLSGVGNSLLSSVGKYNLGVIPGMAGSILAGGQQAQGYQGEADNAFYNAKVAGLNADLARNQTDINMSDLTVSGLNTIAGQRAAQAQAGLLGSPTGQATLDESAEALDRSRRRLLLQGELEEAGNRAGMFLSLGEAAQHQSNAKAAKKQGYYNALTSMIKGTNFGGLKGSGLDASSQDPYSGLRGGLMVLNNSGVNADPIKNSFRSILKGR